MYPKLTPVRRAAAVTVVTALAVSTAVTSQASASTIAPVQARQADVVVQMSGVNVRLLNGRTPYGNFPATLAALQQLGVRHVRDHMTLGRPDYYAKIRDLAANGIRTDMVIDNTVSTGHIAARLNTIATSMAGAVDAIEPPNEWDLSGNGNWVAQITAYTRVLSTLVHNDPRFNGVRVYAPALACCTNWEQMGSLASSVDVGNLHVYPAGFTPSYMLGTMLQNERAISGSKPIVVTETGYMDAMSVDSRYRHPTPDDVQGIYMPRLIMESFNQHVLRDYDFELYDEVPDPNDTNIAMHFGLIANDGTKKPAFYAMSRLLQLLSDRGPSFQAGSLAYSVDSGGAPIEQTLVQRRDGHFILLLWQDTSVWDPINKVRLQSPSTNVTVHFGQPIASASVYRPSISANAQSTVNSPTSMSLTLTGDLQAIDITP